MLYIHDLLDYKHYTFIKLYFVVVNYHSSCKCHLLLYGIHFIIICYELILNRLMSSLGVFLCIIFVSYSLETSNHLVKSISCYFVIALILFHMSFGFSIKLVILNPIYSGALDIYGHIIYSTNVFS